MYKSLNWQSSWKTSIATEAPCGRGKNLPCGSSCKTFYGNVDHVRRLWRLVSSEGRKDHVQHGKHCSDKWLYVFCGVITVGKIMLRHFTEKSIGEQGFKAVHKTVLLIKYRQRLLNFLLLVLILSYLVVQDIKYRMVSTRPLNNKTNLYVGVLFSLEKFFYRLARSTYKLDFLFSNFDFGVLHSKKCFVMFQCVECYLFLARDPILVAFFNKVALFSDFNHLFELFGPGFAPCSSNAFNILEKSSKSSLKTVIANFMKKNAKFVSVTREV